MPTVEIFYFKSVWNWEESSPCLQHEAHLRHSSFSTFHKYSFVRPRKSLDSKNAGEVFTQASRQYRCQHWEEVTFGKHCAYSLEALASLESHTLTEGQSRLFHDHRGEKNSKARWAVDGEAIWQNPHSARECRDPLVLYICTIHEEFPEPGLKITDTTSSCWHASKGPIWRSLPEGPHHKRAARETVRLEDKWEIRVYCKLLMMWEV